ALEFRFALVDEGLHAFLLIIAVEEDLERLSLQHQPGLQRRVLPGDGDLLDLLDGQGRQLRDLQTAHEFTDLLSGPRELQEILDLTVQRVVEVMPVKACAIRLLNAETGELVINAVHNLSEEYLKKGPVLIAGSTIDAAVFAGQTVYIEDAPNDPRLRYPQNARREGIVSGLCVPMAYRGQTIGVLRVYTGHRYKFSQSEELLLHSIGAQATAAIITGRLHHEHAENERVQRQMEAAAEIQRRMLPSEPPRHDTLEFGCIYDATLELGGDFYDFIEHPDGRLGLCIADVVGKGLPAALMMASVRSALHAYAHQDIEVQTVVAKVNQHMCHDTLIAEFATLVYGVFSPNGDTFTYSNAGHEAPLLLRDDDFTELGQGGLVIGVQRDEVFDHEVVPLRCGDILVLVTDGVFEAMDFQGNPFGRQRLRSSIKQHRALDAVQLAHQILWDVRRFVGLADQSDDITIVVVKVVEGAKAAPSTHPAGPD
ncbi:MAG: SpoIIE family protein phosphatase, partial [Planctomycetes bacterium]|nr:SpoIIE family protein phosphatase [Planctomycetota bacterium]